MKLFGRKSGDKSDKKEENNKVSSTHAASPSPDAIRVQDAYGREMQISRDDWRSRVLPDAVRDTWDDPSGLYTVILQALDDGFASEVLHAAQHLHETDTTPQRGACIYAIVLMEEDRLQEAQDVLEHYLKFYGQDGYVLTNLAKVYSARGDAAKSEGMLWRALECDPNQFNALQWYCALHRERGGEKAALKALQKVAELPKSWLPQIWIARAYLKDGEEKKALVLYHQTLLQCEKPVPTEALQQLSGDLGSAGLLQDVIDLCMPYYQASVHGLDVGNNLIKAHLDSGYVDLAFNLLEQLYALRRPDWKPTLEFWEQEIARARINESASTTARDGKAQDAHITILSVQGAVWLPADSPAASLFALRNKGAGSLAIVGSSASKEGAQGMQMPDGAGRLSRALPLFLAEQATFQTTITAYALTPLIEQSGHSAFLLSGTAWTKEAALRMLDDQRIAVDYLVTVSLYCHTQLWQAELLLIRVADGILLKTLRLPVAEAAPDAETVLQMAQEMMKAIHEDGNHALRTPPAYYQPPADTEGFAEYLLRLEQLLALRCFKESGELYGEREIAGGNIALCATHPRNVTLRLLLATTLHYMKTAHPAVVEESKKLVSTLHHTEVLPEPAQSVIARMLNESGALI